VRVKETGASYTRTFSVSFALAFEQGRWGVCPPVARILKGYRNDRSVLYLLPEEGTPIVEVGLDGSANTGPTPEEFIADPLGKAHIKYEGPVPIPSYGELERLLVEGVRELAELLPGRFCPDPPLKEKWLPLPRVTAEEVVKFAEKFPCLPSSSWWEGYLRLRGRVKRGLRQRAFYASARIPAWRVALMSFVMHAPREFEWAEDEYELLSSFHLGHHKVEVEEPVAIRWACSRYVNGHEQAQALVETWYSKETRVKVTDEISKEVAEGVIQGNVLLVHWPTATALD